MILSAPFSFTFTQLQYCYIPMASPLVVKLLFFLVTLALVSVQFGSSSDHVLKGSVTCLDCDLKNQNDLSDIKVLVKCSNVKKMVLATTKEDGTFETELPQDTMTTATTQTATTTSPYTSKKCSAKIVGGSSLLYTSGKNTISRVDKIQGQDYYYTNEEPLNFYKSCPKQKNINDNNAAEKCASAAAGANFGSSKTFNIPLPKEWGLAPSSFYLPFIPIIGIP